MSLFEMSINEVIQSVYTDGDSQNMNKLRKISAVILAIVISLSSTAAVFASQQGGNTSGENNVNTTQSTSNTGESSQNSAGQTQSNSANNTNSESEGPSAEELKQRADLYSIVAIIALAAILVAIREKRRSR